MRSSVTIGFLCLVALIGLSSCMAPPVVQNATGDNVVCNPPYMRFGTDCCLDRDNTSICDVDEGRAPPTEDLGTPPPDPGFASTLHLTAGTINGQAVTPTSPRVIVSTGARIEGQLAFMYNNTHPSTSTMVFGATPTWGDASSSYVTYDAPRSPAVGSLSAIVRFTAPNERGRYHIIFAEGAQQTTANVFSMTLWTKGEDVWDDGNDLAALNDDAIAATMRDGRAKTAILIDKKYEPYYTPATAIEIIVE